MIDPPVLAVDFVPLCMTADELALWTEKNERLYQRAQGPCEDCPLGHAADMRALGMCNGEPGGIAEEGEDVDETIATARTTSVPVDLSLPCGTCAHAPVCRIRPELEALARLPVALPTLSKDVHVRLAAAVECDWWAKARGQAGKATVPAAPPAKPKRHLSPEQLEAARQRMAHARAAKREGAA